MEATAIPTHVPTAAEANSHLVGRINADGTISVRDAANGGAKQLRLAVVAISGQLTLVVVGDP
jgi:hypothetical protein